MSAPIPGPVDRTFHPADLAAYAPAAVSIVRLARAPGGPRLAALSRIVLGGVARLRSLARRLVAGGLDLAHWSAATARAIVARSLAGAVALTGAQRPADLTTAARVALADRLAVQLDYLRGFRRAIAAARQARDGSLIARATLYGHAVHATAWAAELARRADEGWTEARRRLRPADHCTDCLDLAALGWVAIDEVVPIGETTCSVRCQCEILFR